MSPRPHFLEPLLASNAGRSPALQLERTGQVVAGVIELAQDSRARTRGLLGRSGLTADSVMIIAPCNAIHTFFMRFTIDVVFTDRHGRVVKLCRRVKPWRVAIAVKAFAALELAEGSIDRSGLVSGDRLSIYAPAP